jgi:hypothetical protein
MGSIVDAPDQDAAIVYINLIDATGILGEPPALAIAPPVAMHRESGLVYTFFGRHSDSIC